MTKPKLKPLRRARLDPYPQASAAEPKVAPSELTDAEIDLLRTIIETGPWAAVEPSEAAYRLVDAGAITLEPPVERYRARVAWRATYEPPRPWRATATPRGQSILLTEQPRIRVLPGDPQYG